MQPAYPSVTMSHVSREVECSVRPVSDSHCLCLSLLAGFNRLRDMRPAFRDVPPLSKRDVGRLWDARQSTDPGWGAHHADISPDNVNVRTPVSSSSIVVRGGRDWTRLQNSGTPDSRVRLDTHARARPRPTPKRRISRPCHLGRTARRSHGTATFL